MGWDAMAGHIFFEREREGDGMGEVDGMLRMEWGVDDRTMKFVDHLQIIILGVHKIFKQL